MHNGWTNTETWLCALWISNNPITDAYYTKRAEMLMEEYKDRHEVRYMLQSEIKSNIENNLDECYIKGLFKDLLTHATYEINYLEIADSYLEEY